MTDVGAKMTLGITTPLMLLEKKMYNAATDYEMAWAGVIKTADGSVEELEGLREKTLRLSETMPVGFLDLSGIMSSAAQSGVIDDELERFTQSYAKLQTATDIQGDSGVLAIAQILNLTEKGTANIDRFGGAVVDLGNKFATTEDSILEMAYRMASTGSLTGFTSSEILGLSAAFNSLAINSEAGGSASSKLMKNMQLAAEIGSDAQSKFSDTFADAIEFSYFTSSKDNVLALAQELGVTTDYIAQMGQSWLDMEYFAKVSGKTADQFKSDWSQSPAQGMLDFFAGLGDLNDSGAQSAISMLNEMGVTEIRLSNLVASSAYNSDLVRDAIRIAEEAYNADIGANPLNIEYEMFANTQESQNQMLANKAQNTMADVGDNLVQALQPALDMVNNLLTAFNGLSEVDQNVIVGILGGLTVAGPITTGVGAAAAAIGKISEGIGKMQAAGGVPALMDKVGAFLMTPAGNALLIAGAVTAIGMAISGIPSTAESIYENLKDIQITVDEESVNQTLEAIRRVQEASDLLAGGQVTVESENTSAAVKRGYGTSTMYGTGLAFESAKANSEIDGIVADYTAKIREAEAAIASATTEAEASMWLDTVQSLDEDGRIVTDGTGTVDWI